MVEIHGNTYPVRDQIRALGGKWSVAKKCWLVPQDKADEARDIVAGAPKGARAVGTKPSRTFSPKACATCGCRINYGRFCGKCEFA